MANDPLPKAETGVIHGRFQVLHNDHLVYLLAGMALCRHLVVGITNPDPLLTRDESSDPKRSNPAANPLTYFERYVMVRTVLEEAGIASSRFSVVPFPINMPELYRYYVPLDALFFLSIYDDWGQRKLEYFTSLGLATHVLRDVSASPERAQRHRHPSPDGAERAMGRAGAPCGGQSHEEMGYSRPLARHGDLPINPPLPRYIK